MASRPKFNFGGNTKKPRPKVWTHDMARFEDCVNCMFYRPFHTHSKCAGCDVGENFAESIEELDPYAPSFLSKKNR